MHLSLGRCGGHVSLCWHTLLWILRDSLLETLLDLLQNFLILRLAEETNCKTLGTETTSTANTMKVAVGIAWEIIVDGQVDALDINTSTEDVSGNADTLVEFSEFLVTLDTDSLLVV